LENIETKYAFPKKVGMLTDMRAFDDIPATLLKKQPLVVFYANDGSLMSCPGDAKPIDIAQQYKFTVFVYAQPISTKNTAKKKV
jgi:hypothetical protein